jgi:hypothetical protein
LEVAYDHDVNLPSTFLERYALLAPVLHDQRLLVRFETHNAQAKVHKKRFHRLGIASVLLAAVPLLFAAVRLAIGEPSFSRMSAPAVVADCCGVISVIFLAWNRLAGHRPKWLTAMFLRERLRQWHFQMFLDGRLVSKLASAPAEFKAEHDKRWLIFEQHHKSAPSVMRTFLGADARTMDLFHPPTPYTNHDLAAQAVEVLEVLRIEHQLGYAGQKGETEGTGPSMTLSEEGSISEWLASTSLIGAVVVASLSFFLSLSLVLHREVTGIETEAIGRVFGGLALLLAVLSAISRAYRTGKTLPEEAESYREYCDRMRELGAVFRESSLERKFQQLERLELEAAGELRRFLRMKMRATFIF